MRGEGTLTANKPRDRPAVYQGSSSTRTDSTTVAEGRSGTNARTSRPVADQLMNIPKYVSKVRGVDSKRIFPSF